MNDLTIAAPPGRVTPHNPAPTLTSRPVSQFLLTAPPRALAPLVRPEMMAGLSDYQAEAIRLTTSVGDDGDRVIVAHIARLQSHYPPSAATEATQKLAWNDWIDDLSELPADVIEAGCRAWRRSGERWAPTPGQFLEVVKPIVEMRQALLRRINGLMKLLEERDASA